METLFLLYSLGYYNNNQYVETIAQEFSRPQPDPTYGCPASPDLWHIDCSSSCGSQHQAVSRQDNINYALDYEFNAGFTYVVVSQSFYTDYKIEIDTYIKSTGKKVYKVTSMSGGSGPDGHCYTITFEDTNPPTTTTTTMTPAKPSTTPLVIAGVLTAGIIGYVLWKKRRR